MPNPHMWYKGVGPSIVCVGGILPKFPRFVSVFGSNIFVQQLNFAHPSFPHHCSKRPLPYTSYRTSVGAGFTTVTHVSITCLPLYNIRSSTLDLFAMTIHVASFSLKGSSSCNHSHPCHQVKMTCPT